MGFRIRVDQADSFEDIKQGPWSQQLENGHLRRDFEYQIEYLDTFSKLLSTTKCHFQFPLTSHHLGRVRHARVEDHQMVDVANEHLLYVVSDRKSPWHLPHRDKFLLLTKVVITHVAKSRCKLAVYTKIDWTKAPPLTKGTSPIRASAK